MTDCQQLSEASGAISAEWTDRMGDILGPQPRWQQLSFGQTSLPPFAAISSLRLHIVGASGIVAFFVGTGWFVAPSKVVTAAHVTDVRQAWAKISGPRSWHLEVVPGVSEGKRPFGSAWAVKVERHPQWNGVQGSAYDLAVILIDAPLLPEQLCLRPVAQQPGASSLQTLAVAGYPYNIARGETPVIGEGPVRTTEGAILFYDIDTEDGQSGAPLLIGSAASGQAIAVGLHCGGGQAIGQSSLARSLNAGLSLRPDLLHWIESL